MAGPSDRKLADIAYTQRHLDRERERMAGFDPMAGANVGRWVSEGCA